jgi:hypothetical protein
MEINRTGPRNAQFDSTTTQKTQPSGARFKSSVPPSADPQTAEGPGGASLTVTQADLADSGKTEETLRRCFGGLVADSGQQLGVSPSTSQTRDLVDFLGSDPLMRGKLLSYLDQVVK